MKISLNEMVFYGYHGVFDEERKLGQRFVVSVDLYTDDTKDELIHRLEDTVDYTQVYAVIRDVMETEQFHLLEHCANIIADRLLSEFDLIQMAQIRIQKPSVAIQGSLHSVEIELTRERT
ncbi:MAG: dihydroneopterin aldolase [Candidatus Cloacimonetes bacterium]|nr:dihydroneopterin aldolase [Candidatus Cloacimonadota bacterium]